MKKLDLARRLVELGETEKAREAYILVSDDISATPEDKYEAAYYILQSGGDYKIAYSIFVTLYNQGHFQGEIFDILVASFYAPNVDKIQKSYLKNITRLKQYKYIFTTEFPFFDDLGIKFFPYDDNGFLPFYIEENRFGDYINFSQDKEKYFFKDLTKALKFENIFSQFDLEYLYDNVRKSEWVAYDNHIYLHYDNAADFACYLQVLDFSKLLDDEKFVFLFAEEDSIYPIDFKKDYGIDYEDMNVKPLAISEIKRLIWHAQTSSHTGGDFFNEIFDSHPNLMMNHSMMFDTLKETLADLQKTIKSIYASGKVDKIGLLASTGTFEIDPKAFEYVMLHKNPSFENIFIAIFMSGFTKCGGSFKERIVPAIFFQPHFSDIYTILHKENNNKVRLTFSGNEELENTGFFKQFKYMRTFAPYRRYTTRAAASYKFSYLSPAPEVDGKKTLGNILTGMLSSLLNKSLYEDKHNYLFAHSRAVRFEDGKLNPKATFTKLAEFLDLPYTHSMTYCSQFGAQDPESYAGNDIGFSTDAIYRTYDDYIEDKERYLIEYLFRSEMKYLGYDFHYYDGKDLTLEEVLELSKADFKLYDLQKKLIENFVESSKIYSNEESNVDMLFTLMKDPADEKLEKSILIQYDQPKYISKDNNPMTFIELIVPDPDLLVADIYK